MSDDLDQGKQLDLALLELKVSADVMLDALREVILGIADLAKRLSEEGRQEEARELLEVGERGMRLLRPLVREEEQ